MLKFASLAIALGLKGADFAVPAQATNINFDCYANGAIGSSIDTDGYIFSSPEGAPDKFFSDGDVGPNSADPSQNSATAQLNYGDTYFRLTSRNGAGFKLQSMDFADVYNTGEQTEFDMTFYYDAGGSSTEHYVLDDKVGLQTIDFSEAPVSQILWQVTSFPHPSFQFDNVRVTEDIAATPIPAALPLFVSALGGLGFIGWRRGKPTPLSASLG